MIRKLFRQMLLTQILSSMTVMVCMLIDSIMIGRFLGVESMTAYGLAAPVLLVFAAFGNLISAGVQVVCGKAMGTGDRKNANACFTVSAVLAMIISGIGVIVILLFTGPICTMLGAGPPVPGNHVFFLTRDYLRGFIIGAPAFMAAQIMVPYMQLTGNRTRLVVAVALMTVGDIIFDILNVALFKGGTLGMGLASSLSYYIAFVIGIAYFFKKECVFRFRPKLISRRISRQLLMAGVPTLVNQLSLVLMTYLYNKILLDVGRNLAVAAYSVVSTAGNICYSFSSGIASVALMLSSIFYSDEDKNGLRTVVKTMAYYTVVICGAVTVLVLIFAVPLVRLFLEDKAAEHMAVRGMRLFVLSLVPCGLNTCFKNYYQGIDRVALTQVISVLQNFALPTLAAFVLSRIFRITGVWLGFLTGEMLTLTIISLYVFKKNHKIAFTAKVYSLIRDDFGVSDENCFERSISRQGDVDAVCVAAEEFCTGRGQTEEMGSLISASIREMSTYIIDHGFSKDNKEHTIDIRILIKDEGPTLRLRDNCENYDPVKNLDLRKADGTEDEAESGLRKIMNTVRKVNYVNTLGFNNLTLIM
ncbi:MAG: hypothetical protein IKN17_12465 [Ruminococcus sp.]|nr:hypothetical protein [Ruminococcus sp.]